MRLWLGALSVKVQCPSRVQCSPDRAHTDSGPWDAQRRSIGGYELGLGIRTGDGLNIAL